MMGAGYLGKKSMSRWLEDDNDFFYHQAVWVEKFAWWPRRCNITGQRLWFKKVMMGVAMYTGPGDPVFEFKWHEYKEHTLWLLKN